MSLKKRLSIVFLFVFCLSYSQEQITDFHVSIQIEKSGTIQVIENITIKAEGDIFKHGLLRTLPLQRKDKNNTAIDVEYSINSIKKNGINENYFTEESAGEWKIYIGDKDIELENNTYQYQISYSTPYQVGYFDDYDELYWNVTGNGWTIPIAKATCQLFLPSENTTFGNVNCYTGISGSTTSNCISTLSHNRTAITFTALQLNAYEGFTVAASFPKGTINPPGSLQKASSFYSQIKMYIWSTFFGLGMFFFYFLDWKKHGKDPAEKSIIPEFRPPFNWSPAILGYVYQRSESTKSYMASIINTAIKGGIKITSAIESGIFTNTTAYEIEIKNKLTASLSEEEAAYFDCLSSKKNIKVDNKNHVLFSKAYSAWIKSITSQIDLKKYYIDNTRKKFIGFLIFIIAGLTYIVLSSSKTQINSIVYIVFTIMLAIFTYWFTKKIEKTGLIIIRFILFFFAGFPAIIIFFFTLVFLGSTQLIILGIIFLVYVFYAYHLGKYTTEGAEAHLRIEGFKRYLETAEKERINLLNAPELTPELFEELLPYAIALDVDVAWGKNFEKVLELAQYHPDWCTNDDNFYRRPSHFVSGLSSAVTRSAIDPSSSSSSGSGSSGSWSSGSSGGGSSGGGGGGGGGGGW
ncbi:MULTISPECIES: DUF2207 domain-containing protein [Flavobacterium]|uniref:DUF2207 domain-containing protein n=1 Tax=Flavobacterium jumunjinense TaxID=998845 RepID=A0ABV5GQL0_9FLAO|nr:MULTISPECIES: DUF2207 domain-containing protein [Flavobacterium]